MPCSHPLTGSNNRHTFIRHWLRGLCALQQYTRLLRPIIISWMRPNLQKDFSENLLNQGCKWKGMEVDQNSQTLHRYLGKMGKGSILRNWKREFRKVNHPGRLGNSRSPPCFPIWNIFRGFYFRYISRHKRNHDKRCLCLWLMLHRPGKTWGCRHSRSACAWCWAPWWRRSRRARPSLSPGTPRPPAAASCHAASRDVTRPHHPPSHRHVSRLHCSRRGCGLPTGAARGKDGKSAARLASYSGGSSARALVSTPLQLWNVACLVSVWAAVVTGY